MGGTGDDCGRLATPNKTVKQYNAYDVQSRLSFQKLLSQSANQTNYKSQQGKPISK